MYIQCIYLHGAISFTLLVSCVARQSVGLILKLGIFGIRITESKNTLLCVQQ